MSDENEASRLFEIQLFEIGTFVATVILCFGAWLAILAHGDPGVPSLPVILIVFPAVGLTVSRQAGRRVRSGEGWRRGDDLPERAWWLPTGIFGAGVALLGYALTARAG